MTLNSSIDVYFHMRNHYKKLKQVKSVIDCSAPKGRSRRDKSPKLWENSSGKDKDRVKSALRPKTRRNPRDMPRQTSKSTGRLDNQVECDVHNYEQHEYLQFSLRITEDIIKNDLYDNDQMKRVLASHFEANKGRLDAGKMIAALYELCLELNIPITESLDWESATMVEHIPAQSAKNIISNVSPTPKINPSPPCICSDRKPSDTMDQCICMIERKPPIPCLLHPSICTMQLTGAESLEIKILKSPDHSSEVEKDSAENNSEIQFLHQPKNKCESQYIISTDTRGNDKILCERESEICIRHTCDGEQMHEESQPIEIFDLDSTPDVSENNEKLSTTKISVPEEDKVTSLESIDYIEETSEYLVVNYNENDKEEIKEEVVEVQREVVNRDIAKTCKVLQECDKKTEHPKNIHQLNISHYRTTIEPTKVDTSDLNVQTSIEKIDHCVQKFESQRMKLSVSRGTQSVPQSSDSFAQGIVIVPPKQPQRTVPIYGQASNDFIVVEGAVFIPKSIMNKDTDVSINLIPNRYQCDCGKISITQSDCSKSGTNNRFDCSHLVHTTYSNVQPSSHTSSFLQKSSCQDQASQNFDILQRERFACERCEPCRTSSLYNKPAHYLRHYNECDITPQREISLYNNMNCKYVQNSSCCTRSENLLLGNHYSRYSVNDNKNISHLYPTTATQVNSSDILTTKPENFEQKDINIKESVILSEKIKLLQEQSRGTVSGPSEIKLTESKATGPDFQLDVLEKLKEIPKVIDGSDSVDKIIQSLRNDINKYRDGENVINSILRSPQETMTNEREVGSEEIEMVQDYGILKKASINDRS